MVLGAVVVKVPLQAVEELAETVVPDGSVSVNDTPVNWVVFAFARVNRNTDVPLTPIVGVRNDLLRVGIDDTAGQFPV